MLLIAVEKWKPPKCSSTDGCRKCGAYIQQSPTRPSKEWNPVMFGNVNESGDHYVKPNKPGWVWRLPMLVPKLGRWRHAGPLGSLGAFPACCQVLGLWQLLYPQTQWVSPEELQCGCPWLSTHVWTHAHKPACTIKQNKRLKDWDTGKMVAVLCCRFSFMCS